MQRYNSEQTKEFWKVEISELSQVIVTMYSFGKHLTFTFSVKVINLQCIIQCFPTTEV